MTHNDFHIAYIALGSNLGTPTWQLASAVKSLKNLPDCQLLKVSDFFWNKALLLPGETLPQPDYLNGVCSIKTTLTPELLLKQLKALEQAHGRIKNKRWDSRTLDLDLLLYGEKIIHTDTLKIPHPEMKQRYFVLYPLAQIAPDLKFPDGSQIIEALKQCPKTELYAQ